MWVRPHNKRLKMAWLIGIICVVIVIYFWRIFLPLAALAGIGLGGILLYVKYQSDQRKEAKTKAAQELRIKIASAQKNSSSEGKKWLIYGEKDPASGVIIARKASITSNDGLCTLTVEKRINGGELTDLRCPGIEISEFDDIYVKFDTYKTSKKMNLESYSNSDDVYIPSQSQYSGDLDYEEFIKGLITSKSMAIEIPAADTFWVRFSLKSSTAAINQLGKKISITNQVDEGT